jgi:hypothetical protein
LLLGVVGLVLVGHGAESVPQRIEAETFAVIDAQLAEQLGGFLGNRIVAGVLKSAASPGFSWPSAG